MTMYPVNLFILITIIFIIHVAISKVYTRCELAKELRDIYRIPENQLATWICIIGHESNYNTSAISEGAESYGLFQISREYWCSPNYGRGCGVSCHALTDDDIRDDINCAMHIFKQQGFRAWTLYNNRCKTNVEKYVQDCYEGYRPPQVIHYQIPQEAHHKPTYLKSKLSSYVAPAVHQTYEKPYYYKSTNGYSYSWTWNSKDGFHFTEKYF